jgi:trimethylamine--corrinoid protein Co-methyltransferase
LADSGKPAARRRRRSRGQPRQAAGLRAPYISRRVGSYDILGEEGLCLIEHNADLLLRDTGMEFRNDPEILAIFREAGADVDGERVRFEPGMCRRIIQASAPRQYTQYARNPQNNVEIGGDNTVLSPVYGPPFVHDIEHGRRYATLDDFTALNKIHQMIPYLHHCGGIVCEPVDVPVNKRHLDMMLSHIVHGDRALFGALIGSERAADSVAMAKILFGEQFVDKHAVLYAVANTNAPLVMDEAMSGSLKVYARNNQAVACTPWMITGAMSPCTEAGTLAQLLAETLASCALTQLIRPGTPCLMGSFATAMSMRSGAPTFGMPEAARTVLAAGQLARRLGIPFHTVGSLTSAKLPDSQAQQEGTLSLTMAILAGANFINHATGWLEGGLCTGYEKTIIDADLCGKLIAFCSGIDLGDSERAMQAIAEVGPGGHFLASAHTLDNFETAFYDSLVGDVNSFEQWQSEGSLHTAQRANRIWKQLLADYEKPPLDPAILEELQVFVERRKAEMPDRAY